MKLSSSLFLEIQHEKWRGGGAFWCGPFIRTSQNFPYHLTDSAFPGPFSPLRSFSLSRNLMVNTRSSINCRFSKFNFFFNVLVACVSENVVYAIKCHACHKIYIKETGRHLGNRFREHLQSTRLPDSDLPFWRHFASPGQTTQDILVSVTRSGFRDATDRRSFEARMIFIHRTLPTLLWSLCGFWFHIKSAHAANVAIFVFIWAFRRTRIFSCFETTDNKGVPSKRLLHI